MSKRVESPSKGPEGADDATLQEGEGKYKELAEARDQSAKKEAKEKAEGAAEYAAASAIFEKAAKDKAEEIQRNFRPDGTLHKDGNLHKDGVKAIPDGTVVSGVNL